MNRACSLITGDELEKNLRAIAKALDLNISFAAFMKPSDRNITFIADMPGHAPRSHNLFEIVPWLGNYNNRVTITDTAGVDTILSTTTPTPVSGNVENLKPYPVSTSRSQHKEGVLSICNGLKELGRGKTVLSRVITGNGPACDCNLFWVEVARELFDTHDGCFRFIYFTPETGAWIGATPELLLKNDLSTGDASTMALAGTRLRVEDNKVWDNKNIYEHDMVVDYITDILRSSAATDIHMTERNLHYQLITHRCHDITFNMKGIDIASLLDRLSPTPALAGFPLEESLTRIACLEQHPRRCYGGYLAVHDSNNFEAYVNLRCAQFYDADYCIYAGGGITADSDPDSEWIETEKKSTACGQL